MLPLHPTDLGTALRSAQDFIIHFSASQVHSMGTPRMGTHPMGRTGTHPMGRMGTHPMGRMCTHPMGRMGYVYDDQI